MAGTGRGRGRPGKGRVEEMRAESSPARRTTRQQQQQYQNAIPEDQELNNIDPSLTHGQDSSPLSHTRPLKIGQRGTRRDPERQQSIAASLDGQPSSSSNLPSSAYGNTQLEMAGRLALPWRPPARDSSVISSVPSWKKKRTPQSLDSLWSASKDLFTHLSEHPFPLRDPRDPSNDESVEFKDWDEERLHIKRALDVHHKALESKDDDPVILPNFVLDLLDTTPSSPHGFLASRKIFATNFVTLLDDIFTVSEEDALPVLETWDEWFPQVFFEGPDDSEVHRDGILHMVKEIRTQRLIFTLRGDDLASADLAAKFKEVETVFCDKDTDLENLIRDSRLNDMVIRRIPYISIEASDDFYTLYTQRVGEIVKILNAGDTLDENEDWGFDAFRQNLRQFAQDRFEDLKRTIEPTATSVGTDASRLESQQIQLQLESEIPGHEVGSVESRSSNGEAYMGTDGLQTQDFLPDVMNQHPTDFQGSTPYPSGFGHEEPQPSGIMYAESAARAAGMKRQAHDPLAPAMPSKRARRRANAPRVKTHPALNSSVETDTGAHVPVPDSQYSTGPHSQVEPDFEAVSRRAKQLSAAARKAREPQVRSPWVQPDIRSLIQAVDKYKCKWSEIEGAIKRGELPFERPRDQQALRDKARLLKQDFLKADSLLPPSFDLVVLGKKEKAAVIACGKNPDRKEADRELVDDVTWRPINTEYVQEAQQLQQG